MYNSQTYTLADTYYPGLVGSGGGCRANFDHLRVNDHAINTGISTVGMEAFGAYPVPANDVLNLPPAAMGSASRILGADGRVIREYGRSDQRSLDVSDFAPGLYFLRWRSGSASFTQKLVVAH